jgi:hypothetical protein
LIGSLKKARLCGQSPHRAGFPASRSIAERRTPHGWSKKSSRSINPVFFLDETLQAAQIRGVSLDLAVQALFSFASTFSWRSLQ